LTISATVNMFLDPNSVPDPFTRRLRICRVSPPFRTLDGSEGGIGPPWPRSERRRKEASGPSWRAAERCSCNYSTVVVRVINKGSLAAIDRENVGQIGGEGRGVDFWHQGPLNIDHD
jgi:hypothetical protein